MTSPLVLRARAERERRRRAATRESLLDFVPRVSSDYVRPEHLAPLADALERAAAPGAGVRVVVHAPPRHAKTELVLHAIARLLLLRPNARIGFASYAARLARNKSRRARQLAERAGVRVDPARRAAAEWATAEGGVVFSAGRGGPFTGEGFDLLVVDDPLKNRAEAESALVRDALDDWFRSTALTRIEPGGSAVVVQTRWHEDDLPGRLLSQERGAWEGVILPALDDSGRALWPERWPADELERRRLAIGEMDWWSLFQGAPRPRGGAVFRGVHFYDALPAEGYVEGAGLDFAYTAKTRADWSVIVEGRAVGDVLYLTRVERAQVTADEWRDRIASRRGNGARYARWCAFVSGVERGVLDLMGLGVEPVSASADKLVRAQPSAAAWNAGSVLVPREAPWLDDFLREILAFTGAGDRHDDQVDALAGLHHALVKERVVTLHPALDFGRQRNPWTV